MIRKTFPLLLTLFQLFTETVGYRLSADWSGGFVGRMRSDTTARLSLITFLAAVCLIFSPPAYAQSIILPFVVNDQGFTMTITYYYVNGPNTIILIGSIESPQALVLKSLTGLAYVNGITVGRGIVDESNLQLTGGVAAPVSATVTTDFNIYNALWSGRITLRSGASIPFAYYTTPITVVLSGQLCVLPNGGNCFPWPSYNQTSTLALI